jgi:hypothetical protein
MYQTRPIFIIYWEFVAKIYLYSQILFLILLRTSIMYRCMHCSRYTSQFVFNPNLDNSINYETFI